MHKPVSSTSNARIVLTGGPFDGEEPFTVPPDTAAPLQIVWGGWLPWGFDAWVYEWTGERTWSGGFVDALIYRPTGARLAADDIPYDIGKAAEQWADFADLLQRIALP